MSLTFQPEGFRTIEDSMAYLGIRDDAGMTLILVTDEGHATYSRTREGKGAITAKYAPDSDLLLMAWTGKYKTDIFAINAETLKKHYHYAPTK